MLDVRCVMQTDDGALIGMTYRGMRHGPKDVLDRIAKGETVNPQLYYMRATPYFETASEKYDFLNKLVASPTDTGSRPVRSTACSKSSSRNGR